MSLTREQLQQNIVSLEKQGAQPKEIQAYLDSFRGTPAVSKIATPAPTAPKKDLLQKAEGIVGNIFPGRQVGNAIGTLAGYAYSLIGEKIGAVPKGTSAAYDLSAPSPLQVTGDIAAGALTVAAPGVGRGATVAGRIGANVALGAGLGAASSVAEGNSAKEVGKSALVGGAVGGAISGIAEVASAIANHLPTRLVKSAIPKLDKQTGQYLIDNKKLGTLPTLISDTKNSVKTLGQQVDEVLVRPSNASKLVSGQDILDNALAQFPNSNYSKDTIVKALKKLVPEHSALVDRLSKGALPPQEANALRKAIDKSVSSVYTKINLQPASKELGAAVAGEIRTVIKSSFKETEPIFAKLAKEINLGKALSAAQKTYDNRKVISMFDLLVLAPGYAAGGPVGAVAGIAAERVLRSPAVQIGAAKAITASKPIGQAIVGATKAPIIKNIASQK